MLNDLNKRLKENYFNFSFTDNLKKWILDNSYSETFGARPIKRFVSKNIESLIANNILMEKIQDKIKEKRM